MTSEVRHVELYSIKQAKRNPKGHDIEAIVASIRRFGLVALPVCDARLKTPTLVAGHGRTEALISMHKAGEEPPPEVIVGKGDEWNVPCIFKEFASAREAEAYLLADNRLTELGAWEDGTQLAEMLAELDGQFEGTGFDQSDVDALTEALQAVAPPSITVGDVSAIGTRFELVVECTTEASLRGLYDELSERGLTCRTLIL